MNGGRNRGQYEPTTRWGPVVVIAAVVLMIALLVVLFAALSGGSESGGQDRQSAADAPRVSNPAAVSEESTSGETTSEETTSEETTSESPEEPAETGAGDEGEGGGEGPDQEQQQATNQPVSDESGDPEEDQDSGGEGAGEQGAVNEPAGFDPLNKNAEPGDLTETDRERARLTVWKFVSSAYGFSGEDKTAYARGVEQNVVLPDFYESPAGDLITQRVQNFDEEDVSGAAKLEDFEIETTEPERVVGTASYVTGDSFARNGDLRGEKSEYRQRVTLVPQGEIYKVSAASKREEIN